jgi:rare lipoprotein A
MNKLIILSVTLLMLAGCSTTPTLKLNSDGPPDENVDVSTIPDAAPKAEPRCRYGNPQNYRVRGKTYKTLATSQGYKERGIASWYGIKFHGQYTSSREPYNMLAMTAAHRTLPLPTYVKVTNLQNGRQIVVKVNDRGPFEANRLIDLSYVAAKKLGITQRGTGLVEVTSIDVTHPQAATQYAAKQVTQATPKPSVLYLQIGSFSQQANAEQLAKRIKNLTAKPVRIMTFPKQGQALYRVQIGPLANVAETDLLHRKLSAEKLGTSLTLIA